VIDQGFSQTLVAPKQTNKRLHIRFLRPRRPASGAGAIGRRTQVERLRRLATAARGRPLTFPGLPTDLAVSPAIALALLAELVFAHAGFAQASAILVVSVVPVMVDVNAAWPDFELCG